MKIIPPLPSTILVATLLLGAPFSAPAKEKKTESPNPELSASPTPKTKTMPYRGKIASVDANAKTFMIGKRIIKVTAQTKITKQDATATMADITVGEKVSGSCWKREDGSLEAKVVKIGAKIEAAALKKEGRATETSPSP